jgi:dihydrofolate reductase
MLVSIIVAVADNGVIGTKDAMLPWHQSADLTRYKAITMGHPIIMGRKTYESIGKPLPGRTNIVVTRNEDYYAAGCEIVYSLREAIELAEQIGTDEAFVIGGGIIFQEALTLADKLYVTEIHASPEGDTYFRYDPSAWVQQSRESHDADEKNQYPYSFVNLERLTDVP